MSVPVFLLVHVFVGYDTLRKPLQHPYDGAYKVLKRTDKFFTVDLNGQQDTISLDRLKPAHLDSIPEHPPSTAPTTCTPVASPATTVCVFNSPPRVVLGMTCSFPK